MTSLLDRRHFLGTSAAFAATRLLAAPMSATAIDTSDLAPLTGDVRPISRAERAARLEKARRLMQDAGLSAILVEPGSSLVYFTGIAWHRSERTTAALIPARGRPIVVTPFFEEPSVRESLAIDAEVRVWQEDESPSALLAQALRDRGIATGTLGIEETVRFFIADGLEHALVGGKLGHAVPQLRIVSAARVVRGCRMMKSPAEIALMRKAADVTLAAYRWTASHIREGMTPSEVGDLMNAATTKLGGTPEFALVLMGEAAAYPHGSGKPQRVREGAVVLMDCGCTIEGYQSDISRTFVPGRAPDAVRRVWNDVAEGQRIAFAAARIGTPAGAIDDAVRRFYENRGYGPRYKLPGLSHRTGHGIGLDGHEPVNLVHGEAARLAAGMCFSNEPGLYLPGSFGVRIEDCFHMTESGPAWFSTPPPSLDRPFG